jgi:hypothetical protein
MALPQFLNSEPLDYIVFDYLAEITMSILARAREADPSLGYATDFVDAVLAPNLVQISDQGVRIISNAGGVNPEACAAAIRKHIADKNLSLKVAVILGDDLLPQRNRLAEQAPREMFSEEPFPDASKVASVNAYLGAFPIAKALAEGADIVITGRCVDSAVTLGACIHAFGWQDNELDKLAGGSLAGHLIECGPQATGGNFTDWEQVADTMADVGYPIATVYSDGSCEISKPEGTGGLVSVGTVAEQLVYEIGDPSAYYLPDVVCDFTQVELREIGENRVLVTGAKGRGVPSHYKVSMTWADGWRLGMIWFYVGGKARERARSFAENALERARRKLKSAGALGFGEELVEIVGDGSHFGSDSLESNSREVALKIAAKHQDKRALMLLLKEITGAGLAAPAGLAGFAGTRPKPSPVIRLFSFLISRSDVSISIDNGVDRISFCDPSASTEPSVYPTLVHPLPAVADVSTDFVEVPLERLAWGRSGDKGNKANIGVIARKRAYLPWIARALTVDVVCERFGHFLDSDSVSRYFMPGLNAFNFLLDEALGGGGVASLRNDPQGKSYAQILLQTPVLIPAALLEE